MGLLNCCNLTNISTLLPCLEPTNLSPGSSLQDPKTL
nr:MAG TPA: hypothetical protein [Caudoviricetes sp.]